MAIQPDLITIVQENLLIDQKGQTLVKYVCQEALRAVKVSHENRTNFISEALVDLANVEADTMRKYRGRYIFELLQNANDAILSSIGEAPSSHIKNHRVRIELTDSALLIANDGSPFQEKDVLSIYRWGESSKDPNKFIGYKGIGFKSVLEITESPEIFSQVVHFHFDRELCYATIRKIVGKDETLKLPFTRFVFPYSIEDIPGPDRDLVNELLNGEGFATVIRLPLLDKVTPQMVKEQIAQDIDPALLLFLKGIDVIEIWADGKRIKQLSRKRKETSGCHGIEISLYQSRKVISRWLLFEAPKREVEDRSLIDELHEKSWERVREVGFSLALPMDKKGRLFVDTNDSARFFVYFPTSERSGLRYRIHADFYVDSSRKTLETRPYNLWLAKNIAVFLAKTIVPELIQRFPSDVRIVQALVPVNPPQDFAAEVYQAICHELSDCAFVPTVDGEYLSPSNVLLAPRGVWVDLETFQRYFPYSEVAQKHQNRQFPVEKLYVHKWAIDFLIMLGAKLLEYTDVIPELDGRDPTNDEQDRSAFYSFLWNWRDLLGLQIEEQQFEHWLERDDRLERLRNSFSNTLSKSHCLVTSTGNWIKPHNQVYHAKLRQETPNMPVCLKADVIHPDTYDEDGRSGSTYQLLSTLSPKVKDYDAPAIIRNAIIPLFDSGKFRRLNITDRVEIYRYLFEYWRSRRGGDPDVDQIVTRVEVYARLVADRRKMEWRPISEVYLSSLWTGNKLIEQVYDGFENVAFLYEIRGLDLAPEDYSQWGLFWAWLGANRVPRVLIHEHNFYSWNSVNNRHPHRGTQLWNDYSDEIREKFGTCPRHGVDKRVLQRSITLEGLSELIANREVGRLSALFQLLSENWSSLKTSSLDKAQLQCQGAGYCRVADRTAKAPSFFDYLTKKAAWVPARAIVNGKVDALLQAPTRCWFVSASEDAIIRNMLPTPLLEVDTTNPNYRQFCREIGMRFMEEAELDDLIDILRSLPEQYPNPNISVPAGRRAIPRAVSTLTRWVVGRIYNLLTQAETKVPPLMENVSLVTVDGEQLRYIYPPEPVFFADDRYHSPRWKDHLPFAPLDDNWRDAAEYLGILFLSDYVEEHVVPGEILEEETNRLMARYKQARPYMLAVVNNQRTSSTEDVVRYLSYLDIQVVESLVVNRHLTKGNGKIISDSDARIFLEERLQERVGSAGRSPRGGTLYVRKGFETNYDLMGTPIANYVRIPGLSEAFLILLDRGGKDGRLKFLDTRGIAELEVEAMRTLLTQAGIIDEWDEEVSESITDLDDHLINKLKRDSQEKKPSDEYEEKTDEQLVEDSTEDGTGTGFPEETEEDEETSEVDEEIVFPDLEISEVNPVQVVYCEPASPIGSGQVGRGGGGGGRVPNWERDHRLREAYGYRGEKLVYELELRKLRKLGLERPENYVRWLRMVGNPKANHDLESKDLEDGIWVDIVIEVKSTPGRDFRFEMSKEELKCAQQYGKRYHLYRVTDVSSATPQVFIFENPYHLWQQGLAVIEPRDTYVILPIPLLSNDDD
jgi:hypothetical protein